MDAIEVYNSRCMYARFNRRAREFATKHNLAVTVGSDAHAAFEVGRSVLLLDEFEGAEGLRQVIRNAKIKTKWSPWWFHLLSRYAFESKKRKNLDMIK